MRRNTWTKKKRRQRRFFTKNCKHFRYPGCQCHLKYETPPPYSMWFYAPLRTIKIGLKFIFTVCRINFRVHRLACPFIDHRVTIYCRALHQFLIMHMLINGLLLSKFIYSRHTDRGMWTKNNLFVPCDGIFDCFFKLFLCFHRISAWYIQYFCKF